jgi:cytochrome P450
MAVSETEVTAQIRTLIVAGYETTSGMHLIQTCFSCYVLIQSNPLATLSRILIELCRDAGLQKRVRAELLEAFPVQDPTYEALTNELPLLDALVHEVLRVLPPIPEAWRTVC